MIHKLLLTPGSAIFDRLYKIWDSMHTHRTIGLAMVVAFLGTLVLTESHRLEILPEYRVPEDLAVFEKWKKGQVNFELEEKHDIWQQKLKSTSARRSNTARQNCPFAASRIYPLRD